MKIAVLGSGFAGRTLAGGFADLGHDITIGTRDVKVTLDRREPDRMGNVAYAVWDKTSPTSAWRPSPTRHRTLTWSSTPPRAMDRSPH
jgi:nucleoside-diphosphate-sugar epimerase